MTMKMKKTCLIETNTAHSRFILENPSYSLEQHANHQSHILHLENPYSNYPFSNQCDCMCMHAFPHKFLTKMLQ